MRVALLLFLGVSSVVVSDHSASAQDTPRPAQPLTEAQALQRLAASDPRVRALRARVDEIRASQAARAVRTNPVLSFSRESVGGAHDEFLLARQELEISGRLARLREAGRLAVDAAEADAQFQTVQLQASVRDAFTILLLAQEREAVLAAGIHELQRLLDVLRAREAGGEGSQYDRMRGQRALADLEADRGAAAVARVEAQGRLAAFLGQGEAATELAVAGNLEPPGAPAEIGVLLERAAAARADYRALQIAAAQFRADRGAADRLAVPTPTLSGGLKRSTAGDQARSGYLFSVDLSVPLFNRGQPAAALANAQAAAAEAAAAILRHRIDADVRAVHAALVIHRQGAERYRASTADTVESLLKVARVGYDEGELGILELLDAVRQSVDGRLRLLDLAATARRAAIELDRVVGTEIKP
jgi:cobalt-zinc-cadmium efflux system outer membrane protein